MGVGVVSEVIRSDHLYHNQPIEPTSDWGSYSKSIPPEQHVMGKQNTQNIENKNLNLRTRIKRLARKTIGFSKLEMLHDTVIGLFINRYCFQTP